MRVMPMVRLGSVTALLLLPAVLASQSRPRARDLGKQIPARRDVGVETGPHVLHVEEESVDAYELLGRRSPPLSVERMDRQARRRIQLVGHRRIGVGSDSVLRREDSG